MASFKLKINSNISSTCILVWRSSAVPDGRSGFQAYVRICFAGLCNTLIAATKNRTSSMNILILKWVLSNFTLLAVVQLDVIQTTLEMLQSDWAASIVAAKTNPRLAWNPSSHQGQSGHAQLHVFLLNIIIHVCLHYIHWQDNNYYREVQFLEQ